MGDHEHPKRCQKIIFVSMVCDQFCEHKRTNFSDMLKHVKVHVDIWYNFPTVMLIWSH